MTIPEAEILTVLHAIESGTITLTPEMDPQMVCAGDVTYYASNGWKLTVFNDCGEWDYLDSVETSDGRQMAFDDLETLASIRNYHPSDEVAWTRYRIPGYLQSRTWEPIP